MMHSITLAGQRMPFLDIGPTRRVEANEAPRPPILFLHGWAVSPWAYRDMLDILARDHRIIAPYMPALTWNRSITPITSHRDWADGVARLCAHLGLERFHLVGQSTGGGVAACLAAAHPEMTGSLTLIDASGSPQHVAKYHLLAGMYEIGIQLLHPWYIRPQLRMAASFIANLAGGRGQLINAADLPLTEDLTDDYRRIAVPTQLLWGGQAVLFPLAAARHLQTLILGSTLHVVANGHHTWEINHPAIAADFIRRFIAETQQIATNANP